jgi:glycosyltransferase involved in cell wall biosynthesis
MAKALRDREVVDVVGVSARHGDPAPASWAPPIPVEQLPLPRVALYESWHRLRRPRVEKATGPVDVIHATTFAIPPRTAPLIVTVHDLAFIHEPTHFTKRGLAFFDRGMNLARAEADLVHCPSQATADDCVANGFDRDKVRVIPFGVETMGPSAEEIAEVKADWAIDEPYVMWSGTQEPRKNLRGLLEAWKIADRKDERLVLVGPAGWGVDLQPELSEAGRVMSLGFVDPSSLRALYAGAAAFCWPSLREGFGFPVLEAMAEGCPVITSRGTSTEEIVGDAGVLVDPTDPHEIATALKELLDDPAGSRALAERGQERAAGYTWQRTGELLEDAYASGIAVAA